MLHLQKLLKEGELTKFSRKEKQIRMFFLVSEGKEKSGEETLCQLHTIFALQFNDILIYASAIPPTNTTYKVIKCIPIEGMMVDLLEDPEMRHAFQIISTCKSFRLEAR